MSKKRALDAVDVAILKALQADASMTNQAIGELVGLTPGPTHSRIKRLKEEGIIKGIHADLDWTLLGYEFFCLMDVKVEAERAEEGGAILTQVPNIWNVCKIQEPGNDREVTFRVWAVTDSRETMLTIMGHLMEAYDGYVDVHVQEMEMLSRHPGVVNVGRVVLGDDVPVWTLDK
jgi:DNA-binding Lrp family transcriptional regulator